MAYPLRALADPAADSVRTIRAFHGSPYDFDRFDASKINTGEGVQAYGRGLYFAGNEAVANRYRDSLSGVREITVGGEPIPPAHMFLGQEVERTPRMLALRELQRQSYGQDDPVMALRETYRHVMEKPSDPERRAALLDALNDIKASGLEFGRRPGHSYEVEIGYPEQSLLNYDKPFSDAIGARAAAVLREHNPAAISRNTLRELETGEWRFIDHAHGNPYQQAASELHGLARTKAGAAALFDAGIPGLRYLDEGSRFGDGPVTRNYVIFPGAEDRIRILRKYGLLAPMAAGAMDTDQ